MHLNLLSKQSDTEKGIRNEPLFSGGLLQWRVLTQSEKVVSASIVLIPLWWLLGWPHMPVLMVMGLIGYDYWQHKKIRLKFPSLPVISLFAFCLYTLFSRYFSTIYDGGSLSPNAIFSALNPYGGPAVILWYIQSHKIRGRWQVVAWSFSVVAVAMLLFWSVIYVGWGQANYDPPRSLYGILTNKSRTYVPGAGNSNYLIPYFATDESLIPGLVRYIYFFPGPEALALVAGFISLLALDIKNKIWSGSLFLAACFILLTSGTRSVIVVLPLVFAVRTLFTVGKTFGFWFLCALIATLSFSSLSVPPITQTLFNTFVDTTEIVGSARADSTEVRSEIYQGTIDGILEGSERQFWLGYVKTGDTILLGYDPARIGTHSFWLGTLLYRAGVIGSLIFLVFWVSIIWTVYQERSTKPVVCLLTFLLFMLTFMVMEIEMPVMPIALLCVVMHQSKPSST
ncbi:MAG: hypothetical protein ACFE0I_06310 [Elainellaceae cyanobacterium]